MCAFSSLGAGAAAGCRCMCVAMCTLEFGRCRVSPEGVAATCFWLCALWSLGAGAAAECSCSVLLTKVFLVSGGYAGAISNEARRTSFDPSNNVLKQNLDTFSSIGGQGLSVKGGKTRV